MNILILILMFSSTAFAVDDCRPESTRFENIMNLPEFRMDHKTNIYIPDFEKAIEKIAEFRLRNKCKSTPKALKEACRGFCAGNLKYKNYMQTCKQYCEVQRLKIIEQEYLGCEKKLVQIIEIERDLRRRKEPPSMTEQWKNAEK